MMCLTLGQKRRNLGTDMAYLSRTELLDAAMAEFRNCVGYHFLL